MELIKIRKFELLHSISLLFPTNILNDDSLSLDNSSLKSLSSSIESNSSSSLSFSPFPVSETLYKQLSTHTAIVSEFEEFSPWLLFSLISCIQTSYFWPPYFMSINLWSSFLSSNVMVTSAILKECLMLWIYFNLPM